MRVITCRKTLLLCFNRDESFRTALPPALQTLVVAEGKWATPYVVSLPKARRLAVRALINRRGQLKKKEGL